MANGGYTYSPVPTSPTSPRGQSGNFQASRASVVAIEAATRNFNKNMQEIFQQLREDSTQSLVGSEFGGIWEMVGHVPRHGLFFRRFGSLMDVFNFRTLRIIAILDAIWVPFLISFVRESWGAEEVRADPWVIWFEMVTLVIYFNGFVQRLTTSTIDLSVGREYVEYRDIAGRQLCMATFWLDLISMGGNFWWVRPHVRGIACLKLFRIWRIASSTAATYEIAEGRADKWVVLIVLELFAAVMLLCHFFACAWFTATTWTESELRAFVGGIPFGTTWEVARVYLRCLRDGAAMLAGWAPPDTMREEQLEAKGDSAEGGIGGFTIPESICWVLAAPVSSMSMAVIFALLLMNVERAGSAHWKHVEHMERVGSVLHSLSVPRGLRNRILRCHAFLSVHNIDKAAYGVVLSGLSANLNVELKLFLLENLVLNAPFFQEVPPAVVTKMVLAFEEEVFSPGEIVVRKGEIGTEMFFIIKGTCEVLVDDDATEVVAMKCVGDYFGEVALVVEGSPRTAWIRARTFCVLAKMTRVALNEALKNAPQVRESMMRYMMGHYKDLIDLNNQLQKNRGSKASGDEFPPLLHNGHWHEESDHNARRLSGIRKINSLEPSGPLAPGALDNSGVRQELRSLRSDMETLMRDLSCSVHKIAGHLGCNY